MLSGVSSHAGNDRAIGPSTSGIAAGEAQQLRREINEMNERRPARQTPLELNHAEPTGSEA